MSNALHKPRIISPAAAVSRCAIVRHCQYRWRSRMPCHTPGKGLVNRRAAGADDQARPLLGPISGPDFTRMQRHCSNGQFRPLEWLTDPKGRYSNCRAVVPSSFRSGQGLKCAGNLVNVRNKGGDQRATTQNLPGILYPPSARVNEGLNTIVRIHPRPSWWETSRPHLKTGRCVRLPARGHRRDYQANSCLRRTPRHNGHLVLG